MVKNAFLILVCCLYLALPAHGQSSVDGQYELGDEFFYARINLKKDGTFSYIKRTTLPSLVYEGTWNLQGSTVALELTHIPSGTNIKKLKNLTVVEWSGRRYLITTDNIISFINSINDGTEPRKGLNGWSLLREGDWKKTVTGRPDLPKEYQKYFLEHPVRAKIVEKTKDQHYIINAGENQGLVPRMVLHDMQSDLFEKLEVVSVYPDTALCKSLYDEALPLGTKFSTLKSDE